MDDASGVGVVTKQVWIIGYSAFYSRRVKDFFLPTRPRMVLGLAKARIQWATSVNSQRKNRPKPFYFIHFPS